MLLKEVFAMNEDRSEHIRRMNAIRSDMKKYRAQLARGMDSMGRTDKKALDDVRQKHNNLKIEHSKLRRQLERGLSSTGKDL